jgi:23S rRNA (adenine2030-N6)-methyltransferase
VFSYRHSFHAGNHADVLKHIVLMGLIKKMAEKPKGFVCFDTHSGAGLYDLSSDNAQKTNEFRQGIERVISHPSTNPLIQAYQQLVQSYHRHDSYPGSPLIAKALLREQDQLVLMEWHNTEIANLKANVAGKDVAIHHRDGYEGLVAMTPPSLARGLVLIDPSYEVAQEYQQVLDTVIKVQRKWNAGVIAIWYPLIAERTNSDSQHNYAQSKKGKSEGLLAQLAAQPFKNMLNIELRVTENTAGAGMYGSGLVIINAPWQFDTQIKEVLVELQPLLSQSDTGSARVEWLIQD